jgi:hypothetical protein
MAGEGDPSLYPSPLGLRSHAPGSAAPRILGHPDCSKRCCATASLHQYCQMSVDSTAAVDVNSIAWLSCFIGFFLSPNFILVTNFLSK